MPSRDIDQRPDPDALLARVQQDAARARRGRLKIFFGANAGVGKTYAMLEDARRQLRDGADVVVGYVELHGRAETEALLAGLEVLPPLRLEHRGVELREFDLDAALARRPQLVIVDELAHSNVPGSRHSKRWQDVEELRDAGIDVATTVNVQHVESLNDVVAQITGVQVRETVPDGVFDSADEVELIDLPPDDLLGRLRDGKVYTGDKTGQALGAFFRKGNLIALRQLALRATADRVDAAMRAYRDDHAIEATWPAGERLLVCVGPDDLSERVVRAARRLATALHAEWIAAYVETPDLQRLPLATRDRVLATLKFAESLGAETVNLSGDGVADTLLEFARERNVSKILVGKPIPPSSRQRRGGNLVDALIAGSGAIDVYVVTGEGGASTPPRSLLPERRSRAPAYARGAAVVAVATGIASLMFGRFEPTNLVMVYLLATVIVAARYGRGPSVLAAVLSVVLFDFLFVPPYYSFAVSDTQYVFTFAVMLVVGLLISHLAAQGRRQAAVARQREKRSAQLYALARELARRRSAEDIVKILLRHVLASVDGEAAVLLPDGESRLQDPSGFCERERDGVIRSQDRYPTPGNELGIAQWCYDHQERAGLATATLASATAQYVPLKALNRCIGVLGLRPSALRQLAIPEQMHLIDALTSQAAIAIERLQLAEGARQAEVEIESERFRNVLLASISHDLRTPLATIIGSASSLRDDDQRLDPDRRRVLLDTLLDEAQRMNRLVGNLLDLSRFLSGPIQLKRVPVALDEVVGAVLGRLADALGDRAVRVDLPPDLPLLSLDEVMIDQVIANLVENAIKHTPAGSAIEISALPSPDAIALTVRDHGKGLPPGQEERVFDKFHRGASESAQSGFGLGLTICRAIVEAHGGRIVARTAVGGGAEFVVTLPMTPAP